MSNSDHAIETDHSFADGIFVKSLVVAKAGSLVPQHAHQLDHVTFVAAGEIMAWKDGALLGRFKAPQGIFIEAGANHVDD